MQGVKKKAIANDVIFSIDDNEENVMHSARDNIEIMINDDAEEVIKELFDSLKNRNQNNLESIKGGEFVFYYVHLLYYKCHKINPNQGGLYIDSSKLDKKQKNHNKYYQ